MEKIKLGIVEDSRDVGEVLESYFTEEGDFDLAFWAKSYEAIPLNEAQNLKVLLLDIELPGKSGIEIAYLLKQQAPDLNIIMFTVFEDEDKIFQALKAGAFGYLLKSTPLPKIKEYLLEVLNGGAVFSPVIAKKVMDHFSLAKDKTMPELTAREFDVLSFAQMGLGNKEIAERLFVGVDTVKFHLTSVYKKLHINGRAELFDYFQK